MKGQIALQLLGGHCAQHATVGFRTDAAATPFPRTRQELLREILEPSRDIEPKYRTYAITTVNGKLIAGVIAKNQTGMSRPRIFFPHGLQNVHNVGHAKRHKISKNSEIAEPAQGSPSEFRHLHH